MEYYMKKSILLVFILIHTKLTVCAQKTALVAARSKTIYLRNAKEWEYLKTCFLNVGDKIITPISTSDLIKYSVHGDNLETEKDLTNPHKIYTIKKPGDITCVATYIPFFSTSRSEIKRFIVT